VRTTAIAPRLLVAAMLLLATETRTDAYTIGTGFTYPCHEEITVCAYETLKAGGTLDPEAAVTPPGGTVWRDVLAYLTEDVALQTSSDADRFIALSLIAASRYPDNRGASITNAKSLREIHRDPDGQDFHFLRGANDDFAKGDVSARAAGLAHIGHYVELARESLRLPPGEQIMKTRIYVEYYGLVDVEVWAPAFQLGIAAHAVQDSFSHTVRSDDLRTIRHVANYVDAVTYSYDLERDGLRHSWAMDRCDQEAAEIAVGATAATADFLSLLACGDGESDEVHAAFLDKWMGYEEGCDDSNDFCGSKWADVARMDPSLPVWEEMGNCTSASSIGAGRSPAARRLFGRIAALLAGAS